MPSRFDSYRSSYGQEVERSIRFSGLKHDFFLRAKAELIERLTIDRGLRWGGAKIRALDVGCGIGALHQYLQGTFDSLSGCDLSEQSLERARRDNPKNAYRVCSSSRLPYDDGAFDMVVASCVVHHVPPASWQEFFKELHRVVRPKGLACIIEHNPYNPLTRLAVLRCPFDDDAVLLDVKTAATHLRTAGFKEIQSEHFLLLPLAGAVARKMERQLSRLPLGAQYACSGYV